MSKLQVNLNGKWEYVFCRNELRRDPIITKYPSKAQPGDTETLKYFQDRFGNHQFRVVNK
jgi:hypothetical protein